MRSLDEAAEIAILQAATEDFAGLWEVAYVLNSDRGFRNPEPAAKRLVWDLWKRGLIQLVWGNPNPEESDLVAAQEAAAIFDDQTYWRGDRPLAGKLVWIYTTAEGEKLLNAIEEG